MGFDRSSLKSDAARAAYDRQRQERLDNVFAQQHAHLEMDAKKKKDAHRGVVGKRKSKATAYEFLALCRSAGIPEPQVEYRFHPDRMWRFDYAWPDHGRIFLEVQGGAFVAGFHNRGGGSAKDNEKQNSATVMGWRCLKIFPADLLTVETIELIQRALRCRWGMR
jgi:hypothetical protein